MDQLEYNGWRLRNDAEALARQIGVDHLPQYYYFGVYAGWTRGEVENWRHFADLIWRTEAFLVSQGATGSAAEFHVLPSGAGDWLRGLVDHYRIAVKDTNTFDTLCVQWSGWPQAFQAMRSRQPMLRLQELVSDYCRSTEAGWHTDWFYGYEGQCKLLDWAERGCGDPLPFKEMKPVVTPALRREVAEIRARRVGWLLDLGQQGEYHLVYCDEDELAAFRRKHCDT